jgi:hypothetical protein
MELEKLLKWRDDLCLKLNTAQKRGMFDLVNKLDAEYIEVNHMVRLHPEYEEKLKNMQRFELFSKYFLNKTVKPIGFEQKIHEIESFLKEKLEELNKNYPLSDKNLEFCINRHGKVSILWKE